MSSKSPIQHTEQFAGTTEQSGETAATTTKKQFVEPEVSFPVDVLEATTFFIITDSSGTEEGGV
ncbi:MAG TPA: hypothetical protein VFS10_20480 [Pyrinomonadaceae bacterium]|nr:hypothetical protein [Pyrinomonadaceae bacterium]